MADLATSTEALSIKANTVNHPLDPLSAAEIVAAVAAIKVHIAQSKKHKDYRFWFKSIQPIDPPKKELAPWLDAYHAARANGTQPPPAPARRAECLAGVKSKEGTTWYEFLISLNGTAKVIDMMKAPSNLHVPPDMTEMMEAEKALLAHPEFQAAVAKLGLPPNAKIVADGWIYGADSFELNKRHTPFMCYLNFTDDPDSCFYAAPLPLVPVMDSEDFSLVRIDYTPIFGTGDRTILDLDGPFPWDQYVSNEYDPRILVKNGVKLRDDLKPYRVIQPEGASFTLEGNTIRWQKWELHIGFNFREGLVLNDVRYDGRKVFYRLSVSDMTVPYGDPRAPFHRKQAFDLGDLGAGLTANELQLGCDCLGEIAYLDWTHFDVTGNPTKGKSVVCIHEEDDGLAWKHTNYRTQNPSVARSRVLVIQTILTVANYEYIFAWRLDQAAALHLETRATGILSTAAILPGEKSPYGTIVSPGVLGTNHQHLFCVRIDPSIDGHNNTVVEEDVVPMAYDKLNPPEDNKWGVGYVVHKRALSVAGGADAAPEKNRVFKLTNPNIINPVSGRPVSYKLAPMPSQLMLAHPDSVQRARAEFGDHHIYVSSYKDGELYGGGKYTNQSFGQAAGMRSFIGRKDNTENTDIVVWHTFGLTHISRVEDFPLMPCETHMISLKPNDFFTKSPAFDIAPSTQKVNQSRLHRPAESSKSSCCAQL